MLSNTIGTNSIFPIFLNCLDAMHKHATQNTLNNYYSNK